MVLDPNPRHYQSYAAVPLIDSLEAQGHWRFLFDFNKYFTSIHIFKQKTKLNSLNMHQSFSEIRIQTNACMYWHWFGRKGKGRGVWSVAHHQKTIMSSTHMQMKCLSQTISESVDSYVLYLLQTSWAVYRKENINIPIWRNNLYVPRQTRTLVLHTIRSSNIF